MLPYAYAEPRPHFDRAIACLTSIVCVTHTLKFDSQNFKVFNERSSLSEDFLLCLAVKCILYSLRLALYFSLRLKNSVTRGTDQLSFSLRFLRALSG